MRRSAVTSVLEFVSLPLRILAFVFVVPLALAIKLIILPFERPVRRSAHEVAGYLRNFLEGEGSDGAWDYFTSTEIADPRLESLRERAVALELPFGEEERLLLSELVREAEAIANATPPSP